MKRILIITVAFLSIFLLVGCDRSSTTPTDAPTGETSGPIATEDVKLPRSIIVYTNQTSGGRQSKLENLVKDAKFPFDVTFVELAGQTLKSRLIAEKESAMADVVLGGGVLEHIDLKKEGVLRPFTPTWLEEVDETYLNEGNYSLPWAVEPLYVAFNKQYYTTNPSEVTQTRKLAPTSWEDMSTNYKNGYNVFKPSSSTGSVFYYASILAQHVDANGTYNVSSAGWSLLEKVINNGIMDQGLWQYNLTQNKSPISMTWAGAILELEKDLDIELDVINFAEGTPVTVTQVAVINSKNNGRIKAAEMFIEWWGKTETQIAWSNISGQAPANQAALLEVNERVRELSTPLKVMEIDWEFVAQNVTNWREKIELDIYY